MIIGYKGASNYMCKDLRLSINGVYETENEIALCRSGFHYCKKASDVLTFYPYDNRFNLFEIEDIGSERISDLYKTVTNKFRVIREIANPRELKELLGTYRNFDVNGSLCYLF